MSNPKNKTVLQKMIPGLFLGLLVLIGLSLLGDLKEVGRIVVGFNWAMFPIAIGSTLFNYLLRFLKWHFYLGQIGVKKLPWLQSLRLFVAGFPLAMTPGKVGEVLKGVWVNQLSGVPAARGVSVVVAERISDGMAVLILSSVGVIAYPKYRLAFLVVLALLLMVIILSQIRPVALWFLFQGEKIALTRRYIPVLREFYEGSFALFKPGPTLLAVSLGTVSWLGEGFGFYYILQGLGFPASTRLLAMAVFVLAFSTVVGAASALPGGLGAAEASIVGLLAISLEMEPAMAATATLLIRLATLWFGVALGLITWTFSPDLLGLRGNHEPAILES